MVSSRLYHKIRRSAARGGAIAGWIGGLGEALGALAFPWSCAICGDEASTGPFCPTCRCQILDQAARRASSTCPRCALATGPYADLDGGCSACRGRALGFDAALALGPYEGALRALCLSLKQERNAWLAPWLIDLVVEASRDAFDRLPRGASIVPVPLHWQRRWRRGYNQAEALACALGQNLWLPVERSLRRIRGTDKLAPLSPTDRSEAMRGVFKVRANRRLSDRTVLLVDDVLTTGATCGEAARTLKRAGARTVVVVVLGRAEPRHS